jgi:hypothetical protein
MIRCRNRQFGKSGAIVQLALELQVGEDADRNFRCGVDDAAIDHMTADDLALGIGDAHVEVNAARADRPGDRQDFVFAVDRGVGVLARKAQGYGVEATDAAEDDSGGDVFLEGDQFEGLAQVYVGGEAEGEDFEGAAGIHGQCTITWTNDLTVVAFSEFGSHRGISEESPTGSLADWVS